jgi:hypothetical protein
MRRADRLSTGTSHFVSDMVMKVPLRSLGRNGPIAGICGSPYGVAVLKTGFCPNRLQRKGARGDDQQCECQSLHYSLLSRRNEFFGDRTSFARLCLSASTLPSTKPASREAA